MCLQAGRHGRGRRGRAVPRDVRREFPAARKPAEVVDLGGAAEAVGHHGRWAVGRCRVEVRSERQVGDGHRGVVVLFLEAEVPGESAAALRLRHLGYPEAGQQIARATAAEGRVLVAVGLQQHRLRQRGRAPVGCGEVGQRAGQGVDPGRDLPGGLGAEEFGYVAFERGGAAGLGHDDRQLAVGSAVEPGHGAGHDPPRHGQLAGADPGQPAAQAVPRGAGYPGVGEHACGGPGHLRSEGAREAVDEEQCGRLVGGGRAQGRSQRAPGGEGGDLTFPGDAAHPREQPADGAAEQRVQRPRDPGGQGRGERQPAQ